MLNYYHNGGIILVTEANLECERLNNQQIIFYENNPNASVEEILNCKEDVPSEMSLYDLKEIVYQNYANCEALNTGASGTLKIAQFAESGCESAISNVIWINELYAEMYLKIEQIECGIRDIDFYPSDKVKNKPYSFKECEKEYIKRKNELCIS